jgi:hypothetical protein
MKTEIYKSLIAQNRDIDVPEFGEYSSEELRHPQDRRQFPDLFYEEARERLYRSAVERASHFAFGTGEIPPVHFPNAEHFQHIPFTKGHWEKYGNLESEYGRIRFMLNEHPNRRFPSVFLLICQEVLLKDNLLANWRNSIPLIQRNSKQVYEHILGQMKTGRKPDDTGFNNGGAGTYQSEPVFYQPFSDYQLELEVSVWEKALEQAAEEFRQANFENLATFLHLYNYLKDPLTPIRSCLANQVEIFQDLYLQAKETIPKVAFDLNQERVLITQLALESSFLALPGIKEIAFVVYYRHQELPYLYLDIEKLPRGEFAGPKRAQEILNEIIDQSLAYRVPVITPITLSYFQDPYQKQPGLFIIDGNNRATAVLIMKFLAFTNFNPKKINEAQVRDFIICHDLDIEWERDLVISLKALSTETIQKLLENRFIVNGFSQSQVPALLVQEPNFHTIAVERSKKEGSVVVLQPMHQAIYNQNRFPMAIPAKQQSHGRAAGNDIRVSLNKK